MLVMLERGKNISLPIFDSPVGAKWFRLAKDSGKRKVNTNVLVCAWVYTWEYLVTSWLEVRFIKYHLRKEV